MFIEVVGSSTEVRRVRRHPELLLLVATLTVSLVALAAGLLLASPASAATGDVGFAGPSTAGAGSAATGEKPESKLWWNDGSWWAAMFDAASQTHHVFRLDRTTQTWIDTGTVLDNP